MSLKTIRVFAPATVANVVCGYDVLGFAIDEPGDELQMTLTDGEPGITITKITGDEGRLPLSPEKNTCAVSVHHYLKHIGREDLSIEIELHKKMPIGSGLGSSSASTVAGLYAINQLLGEPLTPHELIPFAVLGEEAACGYGHADNVAPAILGGFTLVRSYAPLDVIKLPHPELYVALVYPEVDVPTRDAREMIRNRITLKDAVVQWGNIAGLVSGLCLGDHDLIGRSMQDHLIEPTRSILIPGFDEMKQIALENGALGFGISGSGPSVFSLVKTAQEAKQIVDLLQNHLKTLGVNSFGYSTSVNNAGPKTLDL
ncbi:MAG: homoserine kinase [Mucilaginibacter polytrichastri]|nr:homoserine kinase [Mucilaginibacter polytrichastri]